MSEHLGIRFKIGDAFPAESPLARWLAACAMALNDLILVNRWLLPKLEGQVPAEGYENVYLAKVAGSHLFEVATFLERSDHIEEVRQFVDGLDAEAQEAYRALKEIGKGGSGEFARQLARARHHSFHYSELLPQVEDHEKLKRAMEGHAETIGEIRDEGKTIEFRAAFADEIAVELIAPGDTVDLREFVRQISEHIALYLKFAFAALPSYVNSLPEDSWEYIDPD
jgi:hypothetical protein